jgi:hypothetical protein
MKSRTANNFDTTVNQTFSECIQVQRNYSETDLPTSHMLKEPCAKLGYLKPIETLFYGDTCCLPQPCLQRIVLQEPVNGLAQRIDITRGAQHPILPIFNNQWDATDTCGYNWFAHRQSFQKHRR